MMEIEIQYREGNGPYIVGGMIDEVPFEMNYFDGEAELIVLTYDFVLTTSGRYTKGLGRLNPAMTGELIYNLAQKMSDEIEE